MNTNLIQKIIKSQNNSCPKFNYENPLLDIKVARVLSKSMVKILNKCNQNTNINLKLRHCILENVRKVCQNQPDGHVHLDDNIIEILLHSYNEELNYKNKDNEEDYNKHLDEFLINKLQDMHINSNFIQAQKPEVVRALLNLQEDGFNYDKLKADIIHWDSNSVESLSVLNDIWTNPKLTDSKLIDNICIKLIPFIEHQLLEITTELLKNKIVATNEILLRDNVKNLVNKCSISSNCFQICCKILNTLFVKSNFSVNIQKFIEEFIRDIYCICDRKITSLYPKSLQSLVLKLNIDIAKILESVRDVYVESALQSLGKLYEISKYDTIMLLSHYSQWFDLFFSYKN